METLVVIPVIAAKAVVDTPIGVALIVAGRGAPMASAFRGAMRSRHLVIASEPWRAGRGGVIEARTSVRRAVEGLPTSSATCWSRVWIATQADT